VFGFRVCAPAIMIGVSIKHDNYNQGNYGQCGKFYFYTANKDFYVDRKAHYAAEN
jgi:hypothetical protein